MNNMFTISFIVVIFVFGIISRIVYSTEINDQTIQPESDEQLMLNETTTNISGATNESQKISLIFMSHHRPHNLAQSLAHYSSLPIVNDIIVLHSSPIYFRHFNFPKVTNIFTFYYNDTYGPAERFFHYGSAKTDIIAFIDDDVYVENIYLEKVSSIISQNLSFPMILGPDGRKCTEAGYFFAKPQIILTTFLMTQKFVVQDYMTYGFPFFKKWLADHHGNCEDISLNLFFNAFYHSKDRGGKIRHVTISSNRHGLDSTQGISGFSDHLLVRNEFCRKYYNLSIASFPYP